MDLERNKKDFIQWLLTNFKHENPSVNYLLRYISNNPEILKLIEFSDAVNYAPRGLFISFNQNDSNSFIYYKENLQYTNSDQAFHDLRLNLNRNKNIYYIELDIPNCYKEMYAFNVYQENPYIPFEARDLSDLDNYLTNLSKEVKVKQLQQALNQAVDNNEFDLAEECMQQLEELRGE